MGAGAAEADEVGHFGDAKFWMLVGKENRNRQGHLQRLGEPKLPG
jgi:hypothetical protein